MPLQLDNYDRYEPTDPSRTRYKYMPDGSIVSRRQYDNLPGVSQGATSEQIKQFDKSQTIHRIVRSDPSNLKSIWELATKNSPNKLPNNVSVAFRGQGRLFATSVYSQETYTQRVSIQTKFWGTRGEALREWHALMDDLRGAQAYAYAFAFEFDNFEVVFRSGWD